jgi:hypothetical protein
MYVCRPVSAILFHAYFPNTNVRLSEPVFLNVYGAQQSIPRNEFRQHVAWRAGTITLFLPGS